MSPLFLIVCSFHCKVISWRDASCFLLESWLTICDCREGHQACSLGLVPLLGQGTISTSFLRAKAAPAEEVFPSAEGKIAWPTRSKIYPVNHDNIILCDCLNSYFWQDNRIPTSLKFQFISKYQSTCTEEITTSTAAAAAAAATTTTTRCASHM